MGTLSAACRSAHGVARRAAPRSALGGVLIGALAACSPEAERVRDGGPGADPGNTDLVEWRGANPVAADTTLWPGRAPTPTERLERGAVPPPTYPRPPAAPAARAKAGETPVTPNVPPSEAQQRTFDSGRTADPRRPSGGRR